MKNTDLRADAEQIVRQAIKAVLPDEAVKRALTEHYFPGEICLIAVGKAAWQMARAANEALGSRVKSGVVITKYGHSRGPIENLSIFEAGHPTPDENSLLATERVLEAVQGLAEQDTVLFLLSGGGSALFEKPLIPWEELQDITGQLLACGANIVEMNTIRKRFSAVKGGRFAQCCRPARVYSVVLSDILGDPLDMIASGPACPDTSTVQEAERIVEKYGLRLSETARRCLRHPMPDQFEHVETMVTGSVRELCRAAEAEAEKLGYETVFLTDHLDCEAREAGRFLADIAISHQNSGRKLAFLAGGETVVRLTGDGMGGRNQELCLAAAPGLSRCRHTAICSVGSDGTDGPTDAAGGYADENTMALLESAGISLEEVLRRNDAYHALKRTGGLLVTGPTGTNVNDIAVLLIGD